MKGALRIWAWASGMLTAAESRLAVGKIKADLMSRQVVAATTRRGQPVTDAAGDLDAIAWQFGLYGGGREGTLA